ncbi:hypothetical protein ES703_60108 [subsurface metagenome]
MSAPCPFILYEIAYRNMGFGDTGHIFVFSCVNHVYSVVNDYQPWILHSVGLKPFPWREHRIGEPLFYLIYILQPGITQACNAVLTMSTIEKMNLAPHLYHPRVEDKLILPPSVGRAQNRVLFAPRELKAKLHIASSSNSIRYSTMLSKQTFPLQAQVVPIVHNYVVGNYGQTRISLNITQIGYRITGVARSTRRFWGHSSLSEVKISHSVK